MLNNKQERELAYVAAVTEIRSIPGADRVEIAKINGWTCVVGKGEFQVGDLGIFFEADAKVDSANPAFAFMEKRHYKVKVQKFFKGTVISDGLLLPADAFGWNKEDLVEGEFLTKKLKVTYADEEDNKRKSNGPDKYKRMAQRHPKIFKKKYIQKIYKTEIGKRILFLFFGKSAKKTQFPSWVVKTDEERIQNQLWRFSDEHKDDVFIATEKIDGTSSTFTMKRKNGFKKREMLVCSRNVVFDSPNKQCYYDTNVYTEIADKYQMYNQLMILLDNYYVDAPFVTIQGEIYGAGIQKRDYGLKDHRLAIFNIIFGNPDGTTTRLNPLDMQKVCKELGLPHVPIVSKNFTVPNNCDEILQLAGGESVIDGLPREGLVFRSYDGKDSFKAVDPNFIIKYHK